MCVATTEHLLRVEIHACQPIRIGASHSAQQSHAIHERGYEVRGALVTGRIIESEAVYDARLQDTDYLMAMPGPAPGETGSFFREGVADDICASAVGTERVFITDRPCCDTIPASGSCLVPAPLLIVRDEDQPERWLRWPDPGPDEPAQDGTSSLARETIRRVVNGIIAADNAGDVDAVMRYYADDAVLIAADHPNVVGRNAIRENYARLFAESGLRIEPGIDGITVHGNHATVHGINTIRSTDPATGLAECLSSKYLMTLHRGGDGEWKINRLMWSNQPVVCP